MTLSPEFLISNYEKRTAKPKQIFWVYFRCCYCAFINRRHRVCLSMCNKPKKKTNDFNINYSKYLNNELTKHINWCVCVRITFILPHWREKKQQHILSITAINARLCECAEWYKWKMFIIVCDQRSELVHL